MVEQLSLLKSSFSPKEFGVLHHVIILLLCGGLMCPWLNWYQCWLILPSPALCPAGTAAWHKQTALPQSVLENLPGVDPQNEAI